MKVLLIGNQASTILLFRKKLIEELIANGVIVYTLTMDADQEKFKSINKLGAFPDNYTFSRSGMNPLSDLINTIRLSGKIKNISPDVVFCFFPKPVIFGTFAASLAGIKNIYSLLEGLGFCYTEHDKKDTLKKRVIKKIQTMLYKLALPLAKKVLFLNNDDYHDLIIKNNICISSSEIIGGIGVNLRDYVYSAPSAGDIHFGMVSRLLIEKGVREYIEAAKRIKKIYPNVRFSIAGSLDDNPGGITKDQVKIWEKENVVTFLGQISDVKEYLDTISIFVLPSYREGVPRSTQEAMAIGRPIITTDVPGCRETIIDGFNGFVVPPWDIVSLAQAMEKFIVNPDMIMQMGLHSRRMAEENFDEEIVTKKVVNLLLDKG